MKKTSFVIFVVFVIFMGLLGGVSEAGTSSVTLQWDAPTTNEDGTPLTDLGGYKLYWGHETGVYTKSMDVGDVTTYTVSGLPDGLYYFAVTAYDTYGNESDFSNEVSTTLDTVRPGRPGGCRIISRTRDRAHPEK